MKLGNGVEQAIHAVTMLATLPEGRLLSAADLAEYYGVSSSYLLKHLQALSRSGIVRSEPGPKGGYRLAVSPDNVTILDVVIAVEGSEPAFRCREIRRNGPNPLPLENFRTPCQINVAMLRAERAYRNELRAVTIKQVIEKTLDDDDGSIVARSRAFCAAKMRHQNAFTKGDTDES